MDVQSVSKAQKTSLFGNFGAPADAAAPNGGADGAFSALLNLVGVKFSTGSTMGGLESKLMHSNDAAHAAQAEARDDAKDAPRSLVKAKGTKSDEKDTQAAKDEDDTTTDTTTKASDDTAADTAAAADQTQAAVQAAVETTVQLPLVAEVQAAPVVAVVQQAAVAEAATGPVETDTETAIAAATTEIAAATAVAQPEKVTEAAAAVQQAAGPVVAKAKTTETGPKLVQAAAVAAGDTSTETETAVQDVVTASAKTAVTKEEGPKETRSAAAVDQSQAMSRALGDDTKIQVKVQVTGKVAANQAYVDASPYNIYSGYTGAAEGSTANGQVGETAATNALVQSAKTAEVQPQAVAVVLPPQLQSQQAPAPAPVVRADAPQIQALESTSASQNNSQSGFAGVGGQSQNAQTTAETKAAQQTATDRPPVTPREIVDQIKVVITRAAKSGLDKVQIQLKPAELGRIDVKLEISEDHKVRVTVTADNKETLALLQSDSQTLERTLNDAGLRTDSANLHFNLRSESDPREAQNGQAQGRAQNGAGAETAQEETAPQYDYAAAAFSRGGVDTFA